MVSKRKNLSKNFISVFAPLRFIQSKFIGSNKPNKLISNLDSTNTLNLTFILRLILILSPAYTFTLTTILVIFLKNIIIDNIQ